MAHASDQQGLLLQNLKDAGCDTETIEQCMSLSKKSDVKAMLRLLSRHKRALLAAVHERQKEIDCLDYLVFKLEHDQNEGGILL